MTDDSRQILKKLKIDPRESETKLTETLNTLLVFLAPSEVNASDDSVDQQLYAATAVQTITTILNERGQSNTQILAHLKTLSNDEVLISDFDEILDDPIKWTAVNILAACNGEQHIGQIISINKTITDDKSWINQTLDQLMIAVGKNATFASIAGSNSEFQLNITACNLLMKLHSLPLSQRGCAILRAIQLRSSDLSLPCLLNIFIIKPNQFGYTMSCQMYTAFVAAMKERSLSVDPFLRRFWMQMQRHICNGNNENVVLFYRCCRLRAFYDSLCQQIIDFLTQLRRVDMPDNDYDYVGQDGGVFGFGFETAVSFRTISMTMCLLVSSASPVKHKFEKLIDSHGLCNILVADLFKCLIYDCN